MEQETRSEQIKVAKADLCVPQEITDGDGADKARVRGVVSDGILSEVFIAS